MGDFGSTESIVNTIGIISAIVSTITQCTKGWGFLKEIPTALQVTVFSVVFNVGYWLMYVIQSVGELQWYTITGSILLGFFTAFVTMIGWEKFSYIYRRLKDEVMNPHSDMNSKSE